MTIPSRRQNQTIPQREWAVRKTLRFEPEAEKVMQLFYENVEKAQAPGGAFVDATGFASKALEHACRLAAIMSRIEYPDRNDIPYDIAFAATLLTNYYINEMKRVLHLDRAPREERDDADLFSFIAEQAGRAVTSRDIARRGPQRLRQSKRFRPVLDRLVAGGLVEETKHSKQGGKQLATAWRVIGDR